LAEQTPDTFRLNRFLAHAGIGSRRVCDDLIQRGGIKVNGELEKNPAIQINPEIDQVMFQGKLVKLQKNVFYYLLNKPRGVITSTTDPFGRKTVIDLIESRERIYPVGRLDYDTTGALLLTNDGDLAYQLTHPKFEIPKQYIALVKGHPNEEKLRELESGIKIENEFVAKGEINAFKIQGNNTEVTLTLREGRKREVKKIFRTMGHPVIRLHRFHFAHILVDDLKLGQWRLLRDEEIQHLKSLMVKLSVHTESQSHRDEKEES
jgi:23S rRNA pseudouridine2605 synthase